MRTTSASKPSTVFLRWPTASGEVASRTALEVVRDYIKKTSLRDAGPAERTDNLKRVATGINLANNIVFEAAKKNPAFHGMGTTVASVIIEDGEMAIAHVGDSRVYLIRAGIITQLTEDHSLVAEQVKAGLITKEEAEASGMRNIITRALGQEGGIEVDTSRLTLMGGDRVLLCTDGLTTMVPDESILSSVLSHNDPGDACRALVDLANKAGGKDNITVILIFLAHNTFSDVIHRFFRSGRR
jgi:serine/threonine protein phosphatase PrpC